MAKAHFILHYPMFLSALQGHGRLKEQSNLLQSSYITETDKIATIIHRHQSANQHQPSGPCTPGYDKLFVDYAGNLFPCEKTSEVCEDLMIGTASDGIDLEKVRRLIEMPSITKLECEQCWCYRLCNQCLVHATKGKQVDKNTRLAHCNESKQSARSILNQYTIDKYTARSVR